MLRYLLLASLFTVFCTFNAYSEYQSTTIQQYDVKSLTLNNGLVQSSVRDMVQAKDGLVWLGTEAGVQVYDGLQLKRLDQYLHGLTNPLIKTLWVNQLYQTQVGDIFIATKNNGLFKYDYQQKTLQQFSENGYQQEFSDISHFNQVCQDNEDKLWAVGELGLVSLDLDKGSWKVNLDAQEKGPFTDIICLTDSIITRSNNTLIRWNKLSNEQQQLVMGENNYNNSEFTIKPIGPQFNLVGKQDGLFRLSNDFNRLIKIWPNPQHPLINHIANTDNVLNHDQVNDILYYNEQAVWLGTRHHGLLLVDLANGEVIQQLQNVPNNTYSLSANNVTRLMQDRSKLIWASIHGVGINRVFMNQTAMKTFHTNTNAPNPSNDITAISEGPHDHIWISSDNRDLNRISINDKANKSFNSELLEIYHKRFPGETPYIADIEVDDLNHLWLTTNRGIFSINLLSLESKFYPRQEANTQGPRALGNDIFEDKNGRIYITDQGAILAYESVTNSFTRIALSNRSSNDASNQMKKILQHPNGSIYVLGEHNIYRVNDNNTLSALMDENELKKSFNAQFSSFSISSNGHFYISARGALIEINILQADQPKVEVYTDDQLPDSYFYSIELDQKNNAWLATNNGIVRFDNKAKSFIQFGQSDGVLVREFNDSISLKYKNSTLIFGGINGWVVISPEHVTLAPTAPELSLSSFKVGNKPASSFMPNKPLEISHTDHWLEFSFSSLNFYDPEHNRYSYFLRGFDPNWKDHGNKTQISFPGLPPGKYTLMARAATKGGDWHDKPLSIPLVVTPPFYKSSFAYFVYMAIFVFMIVLFRRYRKTLSAERAHYVDLIETSQQRMKLALWGSGDSIWDWCLEDDKVFRTSLHFLGYEDENVGTTISSFKKLIHPDDLHIFEHEVGEVLVGHTAEYSAQYRLKDKNDSWHWVADQGKVIETTASKRPLRLSGTIRDISLIKRHEQELEELNQELEQKVAEQQEQCDSQSEQLTDTLGTLKNTQEQLVESEKKASLGNLVAGISHEINTPVGIALTAASHNTLAIEHLQNLFLQRKLTVKEMEKGLRQLKSSNERIESSINRTAQLIHTFKQVAVDHDQHEWRIIELPFYLIEIVPTFNAQVSSCNFKLEVVDGPFFDAESSPGDLYQIISQLVHNSVTHGFKGRDHGKITIETELKGEEWQLRYSDNGNGIDEETKNQIFDPFYSTRRDDGFSGLGMHVVSNIVNHSLGGTIECRSDIGKGVRFVITLPLRRPNSPSLDMLQGFMI